MTYNKYFPVAMLTVNQFCCRYHRSRVKVYEELNAGRLKAVKDGRSTLIHIEDAERWARNLPSWKPAANNNGNREA